MCSTDLPAASAVQAALGDPRWHIVTVKETDSTNTLLRKMAAAGAPDRTVVIADGQRCGKGSRGRRFFSPSGSGLYMSFLLRTALPPAELTALTPCAAVAVAETLEALTGRTFGIRWVNDVMDGDRKVCGILTESAIFGGETCVIVGIGVNLTPPEKVPDELRDIFGVVAGQGDLRIAAAAGILSRFGALYAALPAKRWLEPYRRRSVLTGKTVTAYLGGAAVTATVRGIDEEGRLVVETADGNVKALCAAYSLHPTDQ